MAELGGGEAAAPGGSLWWTIGKTLLQVSLFIGLMLGGLLWLAVYGLAKGCALLQRQAQGGRS